MLKILEKISMFSQILNPILTTIKSMIILIILFIVTEHLVSQYHEPNKRAWELIDIGNDVP